MSLEKINMKKLIMLITMMASVAINAHAGLIEDDNESPAWWFFPLVIVVVAVIIYINGSADTRRDMHGFFGAKVDEGTYATWVAKDKLSKAKKVIAEAKRRQKEWFHKTEFASEADEVRNLIETILYFPDPETSNDRSLSLWPESDTALDILRERYRKLTKDRS